MRSLWSRDAARDGQPPRYQAAMSKVYPYSLRPVLLITSILGLAWAIILGVASINDRTDDGETSKMQTFDTILAAVYFAVAGVELFALVIAATANLKLAKLLIPLAPIAVVLSILVQVLAVVAHFTLKNDLLTQCQNNTVGKLEVNGFNDVGSPIDAARAQEICQASWKHNSWTVFGWLILVLLVSLVFASIAITYYRQLADPLSMRPRNQPQAFPMRPPPPQGYGQQEQPWMVPPYPGPPSQGMPYEKSEYHPGAEWANDPYAPPPGSPPRRGLGEGGSSEGLVTDAQEEAWQRARNGGVTAHLTGQGTALRERGEEEGYTVPNREEDEAWERARTGGVTAHLTGQPSGSGTKRNQESKV